MKETPAMKQYFEYKTKYPEGFLFFQMGDFYELFGDDAVLASKLLDLTLTSRDKNSENPLPMAGAPLRAKEKYISKLLLLGYKVVVCDQVTEAQAGKLVERKITQVLSPGMVVEEAFLDESKEESVLSLTYALGNWYGSVIDVSIGKISIFEAETEEVLFRFISSLEPRAILTTGNIFLPEFVLNEIASHKYVHEKIPLILDEIELLSKKHPFSESEFRNINSYEKESVLLLLTHIKNCHFEIPRNIRKLEKIVQSDFKMSQKTYEHLEIFKNSKDYTESKSLFEFLNKTNTPQGARELRKIMKNPLSQKEDIKIRQNKVESIISKNEDRERVQEKLKYCRDLERIAGRLVKRKTRPSDLRSLLETLKTWEEIKKISLSKPKE